MSAMPGMHHAMMMDSSSASMAQMPGHKMAMMHSRTAPRIPDTKCRWTMPKRVAIACC